MRRAIDIMHLRLLSGVSALTRLTPAGDERLARYIERLPARQSRALALDIFTHCDKSLAARFVRWGWSPRTRAALHEAVKNQERA